MFAETPKEDADQVNGCIEEQEKFIASSKNVNGDEVKEEPVSKQVEPSVNSLVSSNSAQSKLEEKEVADPGSSEPNDLHKAMESKKEEEQPVANDPPKEAPAAKVEEKPHQGSQGDQVIAGPRMPYLASVFQEDKKSKNKEEQKRQEPQRSDQSVKSIPEQTPNKNSNSRKKKSSRI